MLKQGDAPKSALLEEFRLTPQRRPVRHIVILAGSRRAGRTVELRDHRSPAVRRAERPSGGGRVKAIDAGGGNAFFEYQVPSAVITLKQGFGRLIRSLHDRGLLALLDNRILKKQYGRVFVESLPRYSRTTDLRKVEEFFGADVVMRSAGASAVR